MAMTRQDRVSLHKKQERASIKDGTPTLNELTEDVPVFRIVSVNNVPKLVEYVKHRSILYKKVLDKA
mgnify:CR=1 FL=1|tara:strand:+ start:473 stop:673 length:201 start_codon:yes stop_codon:yes gene_type:complete